MNKDQEGSKDSCLAGFKFMSNNSAVICGVARDCSSQFSNLIPHLEELGKTFKSYKIIVVENDSEDDTAEVISEWAARNQNVIPILFSSNNRVIPKLNNHLEDSRDFNYSRISRIAFARNLYLDELRYLERIDYVIVIDLDILDFSIMGIARSFEERKKWDCATSSGLRYSLRSPFSSKVYWDTYAYEPHGGFSNGVQHLEDIRSNQKLLRKKLKRNELVPATSAFGGLAIYKYQFLKSQRYDVLTNTDPEVPVLCEHVSLHRSISRENKNFKLIINPEQKLRYESLGTTLKRSITNFFAR